MKILLSPAKLMDITSTNSYDISTTPCFLPQSNTIMDELKGMKAKKLAELMDISMGLAQQNYDRNKAWTINPRTEESIQAIYAFKGEVYRGLDVHTLDTTACEYLQENIRMLSGLYGILKPSDQVMPYRLEMGTTIGISGSKNLYEFWQEKLSTHLNNELKKDELILNLASIEYAKVLDRNKISANIIECHFKEYKNGQMKKVMTFFKNARGRMVRYCAEKNITDLDGVKAFTQSGYIFHEESSDAKNLVFVR